MTEEFELEALEAWGLLDFNWFDKLEEEHENL